MKTHDPVRVFSLIGLGSASRHENGTRLVSVVKAEDARCDDLVDTFMEAV